MQNDADPNPHRNTKQSTADQSQSRIRVKSKWNVSIPQQRSLRHGEAMAYRPGEVATVPNSVQEFPLEIPADAVA